MIILSKQTKVDIKVNGTGPPVDAPTSEKRTNSHAGDDGTITSRDVTIHKLTRRGGGISSYCRQVDVDSELIP